MKPALNLRFGPHYQLALLITLMLGIVWSGHEIVLDVDNALSAYDLATDNLLKISENNLITSGAIEIKLLKAVMDSHKKALKLRKVIESLEDITHEQKTEMTRLVKGIQNTLVNAEGEALNIYDDHMDIGVTQHNDSALGYVDKKGEIKQ